MPNASLLSIPSPEAAALLGWARGTAAPGTPGSDGPAFAVVARRALVGRARDLIGPDSIAFCGEAGHEGDALELEGDPGRVGEELVAGPDLFVQVEAYAGAAFLPIVGPTLLRFEGADDVAALREDLDATARGTVPPVLGDPQLQLADRCALGGRPCGGPRRRLHVDADGAVRTTPCGPVLGGPEATIDELDDAWRTLGCEHACAPADVADAVADARRTRPWWPRVLALLDLLQAVRQHEPGDWTAAGFGDVEPGERADHDAVARDWPVLLHGPRGTVVASADGARRVAIGPDAAVVVDALAATGTAPAAASRTADELGVDPATAAAAVEQVRTGLSGAGLALPVADG